MNPEHAEPASSLIDPLPEDVDLSAFLVDESRQISADLQRLIHLAAPVAVYQRPYIPVSVGRLVAVDEAFDQLDFEPVGEPVIPAGELLFVAATPGVKYQFSCLWGGQPFPDTPTVRLRVAIPDAMIKYQRRRSERVVAPLGLPFRAEFGLGSRQFELSVDDLSLGGVGLRIGTQRAGLLYVGRRLSRVRLSLGHGEEIVVDLDIRSRRAWHTYLLGEQYLIGCRFVSLTPAEESILREALSRLSVA